MTDEKRDFDPFEAVSHRVAEVGFDQLNDFEKAYYAVSWLCFEVDNGGFDQFFFNSSGGYIPEVQAGLKLMGAERTLEIVCRAVALLPQSALPRDDAARRNLLCSMSAAALRSLHDLDAEVCEYPDDIYSIRNQFAEENRSHFKGG